VVNESDWLTLVQLVWAALLGLFTMGGMALLLLRAVTTRRR
jgi:hypothetical protein